MEEKLETIIKCTKCGQLKPASRYSAGWCEDCEKAYNNRYSYMRSVNDGWMDVAKDSGLEIWDRQPRETQLEWSIWQAYRDSYPGAKPTYAAVAQKLDTTYDFVKKVARRWDFQVRLQAWIAECDRLTLEQRRKEVLDMNRDHIEMAEALRNKLRVAIDLVDPATLKPSDLNSLLKTTTELEKKARLDNIDQEGAMHDSRAAALAQQDGPDLKKSPTKRDDLGEVVKILLSAGALGDVTHIGVRKTTEVLVGDADGNTNTITRED